MQDIIDLARVLVALLFYTAAYILPLVLVLSALIRMALGWHSSWPLITAALLAALPQAYFITMANSEPGWALYAFTLLTIVAAALHFLATRGHRDGKKLLIDIFLFSVVLVYMVSGVSWIVG